MKRWALCVLIAACASGRPGTTVDGNVGNSGDGHGSTNDGNTATADAPAPGSSFAARQICAGPEHTCAIVGNGSVKCWGYNGQGGLGLGDVNNRGDAPDEMGAVLPAISLGTGRTATELACGGMHTCALLDNATIKCWGGNQVAQLGLGDTKNRGDKVDEMGDALPAVDLGAGLVPVQVVAMYNATCVRFSTGGVKCWGSSEHGQLGNGGTSVIGDQAVEMGAALPFVDLGPGRTAKFLAAGQTYSICALLDNDQLKCWGDNTYGQLGLGDTTMRGASPNQMGDNLPFLDLATVEVTDVSTSGIQACAIVDPGKVRCWGQGVFGALGNGATSNLGDGANEMGGNLGMVPVNGMPRLVGVGGNFACAATTTGLYCWGYNMWGELGVGSTNPIGDQPGEVAALAPIALGTTQEVEQLAMGSNHVCARFADGSIRCWGLGSLGQLGSGSTAPIGNAANQMGAALVPVAL